MRLIKGVKEVFVLCLCALLFSCTSARMGQELQRGRHNFEAGYYREAFRQLLPLAYQGNKEAQYAVGYMYYYGYGVSQDNETGVFWIKKSAEAHYGPAMKALKVMKK